MHTRMAQRLPQHESCDATVANNQSIQPEWDRLEFPEICCRNIEAVTGRNQKSFENSKTQYSQNGIKWNSRKYVVETQRLRRDRNQRSLKNSMKTIWDQYEFPELRCAHTNVSWFALFSGNITERTKTKTTKTRSAPRITESRRNWVERFRGRSATIHTPLKELRLPIFSCRTTITNSNPHTQHQALEHSKSEHLHTTSDHLEHTLHDRY